MKLEVQNLEKVYRGRKGDVQALTPTTFTIGSGEFVSLVDPPEAHRQMAVGCKNARQFGAYSRRCTGNQRHTFGHD